jgi:hypothetical protein
VRQLTDNTADDVGPVWSPDGSQVAFYSFRTGSRDIFTINADGSGLERVTTSPAQEQGPVWGPGVNTLAFNRFDHSSFSVARVTRAGPGAPWGTPSTLVNGGTLSALSPSDSSYLFFDSGRLLRLAPGSHTLEPLLRTTELYMAYPRIPRGSHSVYFFSHDSAGSFIGAAPIGGSTWRKVITFDAPGRDVTRGFFDTDGDRFYFTIGNHQVDIWIADLHPR